MEDLSGEKRGLSEHSVEERQKKRRNSVSVRSWCSQDLGDGTGFPTAG